MSSGLKIAVFFTIMFSLWAIPTHAKITEISTECGLFDCVSLFRIDRDIRAYEGYTYKVIGDSKVGDKRAYDYGEFVIHQGNIKDFNIEILKDDIIKVSGSIAGASKNYWGFSLLGDKSHLNSIWWNSDFEQCMNWTITESNGTDRINQPVIYNATGLINKTVDSRDFRIVNNSCGNGGTEQSYEILSNTSTSVYYATFISVPANATTYYSFYWYNNSPVTASNDPDLFLYANNGSSWASDGGTAVATVTTNSEYIFVNTDGSNKANYTLLPSDHTTGNWWFSYDVYVVTTDVNGVGMGIGDDYIGGGHAGYQDWITWLSFYGANLDCIDGIAFNHIISTYAQNQWYTIKTNISMPVSSSGGNNVTYNDNNVWTSCGGYPVTYNSMHQLRLEGSGGDIRVKNIFLSNHSFNTYNKPLAFNTSSIEYKPPDIVLFNTTFIDPTPPGGNTYGFEQSHVFAINWSNTTRIDAKTLEIITTSGATNYTSDSGVWNLTFLAGQVVHYRGIVTTFYGDNYTDQRVIYISSYTTEEIGNQITPEEIGYLILFIIISIIAYFVFFK